MVHAITDIPSPASMHFTHSLPVFGPATSHRSHRARFYRFYTHTQKVAPFFVRQTSGQQNVSAMEDADLFTMSTFDETMSPNLSETPKPKFPASFAIMVGFIALFLIAGVFCLVYCYCKQKKLNRQDNGPFGDSTPPATTYFQRDSDNSDPAL